MPASENPHYAQYLHNTRQPNAASRTRNASLRRNVRGHFAFQNGSVVTRTDGFSIRWALALLDQPENGERVAIVLGREVSDGERLRRPRHQLLDKSGLTEESGPEGEIVVVNVVVMVPVTAFFTLP